MSTGKQKSKSIKNGQNKNYLSSRLKAKNAKLQVAPLERSSLKNKYISLLNTNSNKKPGSSKSRDTITIVDINEIKNRPLTRDRNVKMVAKIKPVLQNENKNLPLVNSLNDISTKYEKSYFLSYVSLKSINFSHYDKVSDFTYKIKDLQKKRSVAETVPQKKRKKRKVNILLSNRKQETNSKPCHPSQIDDDNRLPDSTSRIYRLFINDKLDEQYIDPFETDTNSFLFESVAYTICKSENIIKLPSHQWCCSLRHNVVTTQKSLDRVIGKFEINGKEKTLYYDNSSVLKYVNTFSEIIKMKSFDFMRYRLVYANEDLRTKIDRCITIFKGGDYSISIDGINVGLCAAPRKVKNIFDIEILLSIIDDISLKHELIITK